MQKRNNKIWLIALMLTLFILSGVNAYAQVMEIEVIGGGYRLAGPDMLTFASSPAAFNLQTNTIYIGDLDPQNEKASQTNVPAKDFLLIEDQNGGTPFNVSVSATDLTDSAIAATIPNSGTSSGLIIKNYNGTGAQIVAHNAQTITDLTGITLAGESNNYVSLGSQVALFQSEGRAPGAWRIFPMFQVKIPANTLPGTYVSTLTFTII